jgi:hypothetical protein
MSKEYLRGLLESLSIAMEMFASVAMDEKTSIGDTASNILENISELYPDIVAFGAMLDK